MLLSLVAATRAPVAASPPVGEEPRALDSGQVITVGVAAAMSGPASFLGWPQPNAVQLAISQTNAAGGIDVGGVPYTLVLVAGDSGCNGPQGLVAANALLDAGAVAVVGHTCSAATNAAQPIYNAAGVPMVSPSSTDVTVTEQGYTTTFRLGPRDDAMAIRLATFYRRALGMQRAAIVEPASGSWFAPILTAAFSTTFTSLGGNVTSQRIVASSDDYTTTLAAIKLEDPDVIYYTDDDGAAAGSLSRVAHDLGMTGVAIAWDLHWAGEEAFAPYEAAAGPAAEGDYAGVQWRRNEDMPGYEAFNQAYQAAGFPEYGDEAHMWGALAYDAARIIFAAIDRADSIDPADIRDEIAETVNYHGVVGTYRRFDAKGDVVPQCIWLASYQNGAWGLVDLHAVNLPILLSTGP
jgi:branched-chain amino acid transport system substrate-binding protein